MKSYKLQLVISYQQTKNTIINEVVYDFYETRIQYNMDRESSDFRISIEIQFFMDFFCSYFAQKLLMGIYLMSKTILFAVINIE